jgi:hypothetical protein
LGLETNSIDIGKSLMLYPAPENGIIRKGRKGEKRRGAGEKKRDDKQKRMG